MLWQFIYTSVYDLFIDTRLTEEEVDALQKLFRENNIEAPPGLDSLSFEQVTMLLRKYRRDDLADSLRVELDKGMWIKRALQYVCTHSLLYIIAASWEREITPPDRK